MKVKDIMSINPQTVTPKTSIKEVSEIFNRIPYWSIFIVESNKLLGIVTRNDLRVRSQNFLPSEPISKIMSTTVFRIDKEAEVENAISLLNHYDSNSLAVIDGERLCGIITRFDIKTKYTRVNSSNSSQQSSTYKSYSNKKTNQNSRLLSIVVLLLLFGIIFIFFQRGWFSDIVKPIEKKLPCVDNTSSGECSNSKPYYCNNGALLYNPSECGCPGSQILDAGICREYRGCSDGTLHNTCSVNAPFFCYDGNLTENIQVCGCGHSKIKEGDNCRPQIDCSDGTADTNCSTNLPYFCYNGTLEQKASLCGCPEILMQSGDTCYDPYVPDTTENYIWLHQDIWYNLSLNLSSKLNEYYQNSPRDCQCKACCNDDDYLKYWKNLIFEKKQQKTIDDVISQVNMSDGDDRLITILGFVQSLPYDYESLNVVRKQYFPYQTLYYKKGVCSDKSLLGAAITSRLGYGVALFEYDPENHMAIGIKCPIQLSNYGSGFCFFDMVNRCSKLTDYTGDYVSDSNGGTTKLYSTPKITVISDGKELQESTVMNDINALKEYQSAMQNLTKLQQVLSDLQSEMSYASSASEYNSLVNYYNGKVREYNKYVNITSEYYYCK